MRTNKPPLGLLPRKLYTEFTNTKRFNEVCGAISRYYNAGRKINIEWIEEYNDLVGEISEYSEINEEIKIKEGLEI